MMDIRLKGSNSDANSISFILKTGEEPIIKLCLNGDIFVKGKLIENDLEVVDGFREFLKKAI